MGRGGVYYFLPVKSLPYSKRTSFGFVSGILES